MKDAFVTLENELTTAQQRIAELEDEDRQWEKHSLVQIVQERGAFQQRAETAERELMAAKVSLTDLAAEKARASLYARERSAARADLGRVVEALKAWKAHLDIFHDDHGLYPKGWGVEVVKSREVAEKLTLDALSSPPTPPTPGPAGKAKPE